MKLFIKSVSVIVISLFMSTAYSKGKKDAPKLLCDDQKTEDKLDNSCPYYLCGNQVKQNPGLESRSEVCRSVKLYMCPDAKTEVTAVSECPEYNCPDGSTTLNPNTCD